MSFFQGLSNDTTLRLTFNPDLKKNVLLVWLWPSFVNIISWVVQVAVDQHIGMVGGDHVLAPALLQVVLHLEQGENASLSYSM